MILYKTFCLFVFLYNPKETPYGALISGNNRSSVTRCVGRWFAASRPLLCTWRVAFLAGKRRRKVSAAAGMGLEKGECFRGCVGGGFNLAASTFSRKPSVSGESTIDTFATHRKGVFSTLRFTLRSTLIWTLSDER